MLNTTMKRILLSIHILLATIWLGGLAVILLLVHTKTGIANGDELAAVDRNIFYIHEYAVTNAMFGFVYTGLCFSLFTQWGGFKFHWVALKWVILFCFGLVITAVITPEINSMAAISDAYRADALTNPAYLQSVANVILFTWIELAILIAVVILSVFKPWGVRRQSFPVNRQVSIAIGGVLAVVIALNLFQQNAILQAYRQRPVPPVNLATVADGTYQGKETTGGFTYVVEVAVAQHKIARINILRNRPAVYPLLAAGVARKVMNAQRVNVDAVTGATTTSKALLLAIEDALRQGVKQ